MSNKVEAVRLTPLQKKIIDLMRLGWLIHPTWVLQPPYGIKGDSIAVTSQTVKSLREKGLIASKGYPFERRTYSIVHRQIAE